MILGLTAIDDSAINGICDLPSTYDLSVPSQLNSLLANPLLERVYAIVATPYDPVNKTVPTFPAGGAQGVWLCSNEFHSQPTDTPANQHFLARLRSPYNVQFSLFSSGKLAGHSLPAYGTVEILNTGGELDQLTGWSWAGCSVKVYLGQKGAAWSTFSLIFSGTAAGLQWTTESILIQLRDLQQLFAVPLQKSLYTSPVPQVVTGGVGGDSISMGNVLPQTGSMTFEAWVYVPSAPVGGTHIAGKYNGTHGWAVALGDTGPSYVTFYTFDISSTTLTSSAGAITYPGWQHVACVYDHTGQTKTIYVMGVQVATVASLTGTLVDPGSALAFMGGSLGNTLPVSSRLDEVRLWSVARTQTQIQTNMRLRMVGNEAGLAGYWPGWASGNGTGSTLYDQTSGAHNGTFSGCAWGTGDWVDPSIAGKPLPTSYGVVRFREAILVDANTPNGPTYQVHDRAFQSIDAVYDKGAALTVTTQYTADLNRGYITLQQAPAGQITVDLHGDSGGSGYVSNAADIARRIATRHGGLLDPSQINTGSFSATDTSNGAPIGYATDLGPVNIDAALDEVMSSIGGYWTFNRQGLLTVGVLTAPLVPSLVLTERDAIIDAKPLQRSATPEPCWRQNLGYHRIWKTLKPADIVTSVAKNLIEQYGQDYSSVTAVGSLQAPSVAYPLAEDRAENTLLDASSDAQTEANRRFALYSSKRDIYRVVLSPRSLFQYFLGDVVQLNVNLQNQAGPIYRLGLNGANFVVVGVIENVIPTVDTPDDIEIDLWGVANQVLTSSFLVNDDMSRRGTDAGDIRVTDT